MNEETTQLDNFTKQIPTLPYLVIKTRSSVGLKSETQSGEEHTFYPSTSPFTRVLK